MPAYVQLSVLTYSYAHLRLEKCTYVPKIFEVPIPCNFPHNDFHIPMYATHIDSRYSGKAIVRSSDNFFIQYRNGAHKKFPHDIPIILILKKYFFSFL